VWEFLDENEKRLVIDRLGYVLRSRHWYANKYIYPRLWQYVKDFEVLNQITPDTFEADKELLYFIRKYRLEQFYVRQKRKVDSRREKGDPVGFAEEKIKKERLLSVLRSRGMTKGTRSWVGKSVNGLNKYKNGNMYWAGTMYTLVDLPKGVASVNIEAKGSASNGIFPYMIVELDNEVIGEKFVDSSGWKNYSFKTKGEPGIKVLGVTFLNDGSNEEKGEDRNLHVREVRIK